MTVTPQTYLSSNQAQLWLGSSKYDGLLLLTGDTVDDDGHQFTILAQSAESTWDNPVPVDVAVQRWMADGAVAATQGHDNRSPSFKVIVSAGNAADLAAGEAALAKRANCPGTLVWYPPSGPEESPASVFEIWTWHLEHTFDEDREMRLARMYGVQATAKPWVRSLDVTEVAALATVASPTITGVDTCTSLTGWTGYPNTPTLSGGTAVQESVTLTDRTWGPVQVSLTRTGSVTGVASHYLILDATVSGGRGTITDVAIDGQPLVRAGGLGSQSWWAIPDDVTSFTTLAVTGSRTFKGQSGAVALSIADVSLGDTLGGIGTHRQMFRTMDVGGAVPTSGSLEISSPDGTTSLGQVLLYTAPDDGGGYVPALRRYRTDGDTVTVDAATVSGAREKIVVATQFTIPPGEIVEGTYPVVARMRTDAVVTEPVVVMAYTTGSTVFQQIVTQVPFAAANTWQWCILGLLELPPQALPAESQLAMNINITPGLLLPGWASHDITIDEAYVLDITHGALTMVDATGFPRMWIDAPDVDNVRNRPAVYLGTADDRSDAMGAKGSQVQAFGDHDLDPDGVVVFSVTDGVADAVVSASFFHRWHTHAGD